MKTIKNQSPHRPKGMLIDVNDDDVEEILKTGEFISIDIKSVDIKSVDVEDLPTIDWTEKSILAWVNINRPDIKYHPTKHTKKWILEQIDNSIREDKD